MLPSLLRKKKLTFYIQHSLVQHSRHGHTLRGKPPGVAKTLEQRLEEENVEDQEVTARINIGFPKLKASRSSQLKERLTHLKAQRNNIDLERKSRNNTLMIDLEKVQDEYHNTIAPYQYRIIADHYGIFKDLFGLAYFIPRVVLDIKYKSTEDILNPVYNGNIIKPAEAANEPVVSFDGSVNPITGEKSTEQNLWTLVATNPDGHFTSNDSEYVHWFVANIPSGNVTKGQTIVDYLQPFPPRGLGYQRFIFVLYKQNNIIDFNEFKIKNSKSLEERTFKTIDFYRKYQNEITPAGLAFFQTDWDKSLTKFYHDVLKMKEPIYEYDFPKPYMTDQKWFPLKQPFNIYLDKHRDIKEVNKDYLEKKLAKTHPFNGPDAPSRFPNAHPIRNVPSWLRVEMKKDRLKIGRINDY